MDVEIDFETRCDEPIKNGVERYAAHESLTILCMAHAVDDGPVHVWSPGQPLPSWFDRIESGDVNLHAHNARFERLIWRQQNWPQPKLKQWWCSAAQAAAAGLPRSLDGAARAVGLPVRKDTDGKALIRKLCVPRKETKTNKAKYNDDAAALLSLKEYCAQDVATQRALRKALPPLPPRERQAWLLDQIINDRGFAVDLQLVESVIRLFEQHERELVRDLKKLTGGKITTGTQVARMVAFLREHEIEVMDMTAATVGRLLAEGGLPEPVRQLLTIRVQLAKASVKKYLAFRKWTSADNRLRGAHLYFGAGTGRWAGQGVQTQNIPRGNVKTELLDEAIESVKYGLDGMRMLWGDVSQALSSLIRPMIVAAPGKRLLVVDFAGIEARYLAWSAGQADLIEQFRTGADTYKTLASAIYDVPVDAVTKDQRQVGKIARLGLGYQMGWSKFQATAGQYGVSLTDEFCQKVVATYREQSENIVQWWWDLERQAIQCVKTGKATKCAGGVTWYRHSKWLMCRLPSGRNIPYFLPMVQKTKAPWGEKDQLSYMGIDSETKRFRSENTYGGKIAENIVQGGCRDLLVDAMVRAEVKGYPIVLHVHDEAVAEVETGSGSLEEFESIIKEVPIWAKGCPIDVEGFETLRYRK